MLDPTATLRTIKTFLSEEYVRRVLAEVLECERSLGDARVCIALNGDAKSPSYWIRAIMDLETGEGTSWEWFSGKTHRVLSKIAANKLVWSQQEMTMREVQELIGEIRHFQKRPLVK